MLILKEMHVALFSSDVSGCLKLNFKWCMEKVCRERERKERGREGKGGKSMTNVKM